MSLLLDIKNILDKTRIIFSKIQWHPKTWSLTDQQMDYQFDNQDLVRESILKNLIISKAQANIT